jgi:hypothetical protein
MFVITTVKVNGEDRLRWSAFTARLIFASVE